MSPRRRIGIFGWGLVAPKSPDLSAFESNLDTGTTWLEPFEGFGPSNFLVGNPQFSFADYKAWIDARFEPRRFAQLETKMGSPVKFALGAFIQALEQNPDIEKLLQELKSQAHVYVGTGVGDLTTQLEISRGYLRAQRRWNRFWCQEERNSRLAAYRNAVPERKRRLAQELGLPEDPRDHDPGDEDLDEIEDAWFAAWVNHSDGLNRYLAEARQIEAISVEGDVESSKRNVIRHKLAARKKLNKRYACPPEPWTAVPAKLIWNVPNVAAAQISMVGRITGPCLAPSAACSGFGTALKLADNAIQLGQAKLVVVGMADPEPNPLLVGAFSDARVVSQDGQVSAPFTGLRGTHIAGGSCVWIVGDLEWARSRGLEPVGLEILSVALTADADHIITPSDEGPLAAIQEALEQSGLEPDDIAAWDMHATATPGDWTELQAALSVFPESTLFTARKGVFGHGMSVSGGWELTAQHLGVSRGTLKPCAISPDDLHPLIRPYRQRLVMDQPRSVDGHAAGKISMGVGGVNCCVVCRRFKD